MAVILGDIKKHYAQDKNLQEKSVDEVVEWVKGQPHLPNIHEIQAILFLQKLNYNIDDAKNAIDTYFTFRTYFSDLFLGRNPLSSSLQEALDVFLLTILPNKTPEGYSVYLIKPMDSNVNNYHFPTLVKYLDMVASLHLHREGASKGYILVAEFTGFPYEFLSQMTPAIVRSCLHNIEHIIPWQFKSLHFFNVVPFISEFIALIKPFFGKQLTTNFHVHSSVDDLVKHIPLECLPRDYGGPLESVSTLHERNKDMLIENAAFFNWEDQQTVDETKRIDVKNGNPLDESHCFQNWEID